MSYSIIFQTKISRLPDGRIIHFDRSGCNNDTAGRTKGEFTAKIYTEKDFVERAEGFMMDSKPYKQSKYFDLKIGSRIASYYDYGQHLLRMLKRAKTIEEIIAENTFSAYYCTGVEVCDSENNLKEISLTEFEETYTDYIIFKPLYKYLYDAESLITALDANESVVARIS